MPLRLATSTKNAILTSVAGLVDAGAAAGVIKIYSSPQPDTADETATGTLLATIVLGAPSFVVASGVAVGADPDPVDAVATGVAAWFRLEDSDGGRILDGDISDSSGLGVMKLASVDLVEDSPVDITQLTINAG